MSKPLHYDIGLWFHSCYDEILIVLKITWLEAFCGFTGKADQMAVSGGAEDTLKRMAADVMKDGDLIAIYIPLTTASGYGSNDLRGKVSAAVKLKPMPADEDITDYYFDDALEGTRRWPIGWPCEAILAPAPSECRSLKPLVELIHGTGSFSNFAAPLHKGPIKLTSRLGSAIKTQLVGN